MKFLYNEETHFHEGLMNFNGSDKRLKTLIDEKMAKMSDFQPS